MKFLTTKAISAGIEDIIRKAQKEIIIISPYVKLDDIWKNRLKEASEKKFEIKFIFGKEKEQLEKKENENVAKELSKIKFYFFKNLHAKCYINESVAIITSMNLHSYSEQNNYEMGILIEKATESEIYNEIYQEAQSILNSSEPHKNKSIIGKLFGGGNKPEAKNNNVQPQKDTGFCIRCQKRIDLNPKTPLCRDCYTIWKTYSNDTYVEKYCHKCGKAWQSCLAKPLCKDCFLVDKFGT